MMKIIVSLMLICGVYMVTGEVDDLGCGGAITSVESSELRSGRRGLLQQWKSCSPLRNTKINGMAMKKMFKVKQGRHCCVKCKDNPPCMAWRWNKKTGKCSLFDKEDRIRAVESSGHTSGLLEWRMSGQNSIAAAKPPASIAAANPTPAGRPPSGSMEGKVIYGRRLNSHLPCRGNVARSASECESDCRQVGSCEAWSFTDRFNCGWVGESKPVGLCYLMADVSRKSVFDAAPDESFISGWV